MSNNDENDEDPFETRCNNTRIRIEASECTEKQKGNLIEMLDNVEPKDNAALGEVNKQFQEYEDANVHYPPAKKEPDRTFNYKAVAAEQVVLKALQTTAEPIVTADNVGKLANEIQKALESVGVKSDKRDIAKIAVGNSHRGANGIMNEVCISVGVYKS